jgi:hypothetical protein
MGDVPSVRELAERNISLNKSLIKGKAEFVCVNWYCLIDTGRGKRVWESVSRCRGSRVHRPRRGKSVCCTCCHRWITQSCASAED